MKKEFDKLMDLQSRDILIEINNRFNKNCKNKDQTKKELIKDIKDFFFKQNPIIQSRLISELDECLGYERLNYNDNASG